MNKTIVILLAAAGDSDSVTVEVLAQSTQRWDGQPLPEYELGAAEVTILRTAIPPRTKLPLHAHPVINAGALLKGQLTVVKKTSSHGRPVHYRGGGYPALWYQRG
ncbi:MAG: hypothetical protein U5R06_00875 [candidate division KSB1 bacterium]|nr:hypothetical protein [candidate division KSB1 bacterium]